MTGLKYILKILTWRKTVIKYFFKNTQIQEALPLHYLQFVRKIVKNQYNKLLYLTKNTGIIYTGNYKNINTRKNLLVT